MILQNQVPKIEELETRRNVKGLIKALRYKDRDIRRAAAGALGRLGDALAVDPLIVMLKDADWQSREAAAQTLGNLGDRRAVEPLISIFGYMEGNFPGDNEDLKLLKMAAAEALGKLGDARAIKPLIGVLTDNHISHWNSMKILDDLRRAAAQALVKLGAPAIEPLIAALQSNHVNVRSAAVSALEELRWKPGSDKNGAWYWIAKNEWGKCIKVGVPAVQPLIYALLEHNSEAAGEALLKLGDPAVEPLITVLESVVRDNRAIAARVLVKIYTSGSLNDSAKIKILRMRPNIIKPKSDIHNDNGVSVYASDCQSHTDETSSVGIGVEFPI